MPVDRESMLELHRKAELALREAVAGVIEGHRRLEIPLVIGRDGKVVFIPPEELPLPQEKDAPDSSAAS